MLRKQLLDSSRGRIVTLLQAGPRTIDDMAAALGLTPNAVRAQITSMERDGVVQRVGFRAGATRPSQLFELTPEVEQLLSRAYVPLLLELVRVFAEQVPPADLDRLFRQAGAALADELLKAQRPTGTLEARAKAASDVLNEQLGALTQVKKNGGLQIRGVGCPLAAVTGKHEAVCRAMEAFVEHVVGAPVRHCCDREGRPRCCFQIG
jgi:predicted ArsR family transcriptional regulator